MTSPTPAPTPTPEPDPNRPEDAESAALFDAVATEHAAIYGYGLVSAHVMPEDNELVSEAVAQHRDRREAAISILKERSITAPLPAAGYQLPFPVTGPIGAGKLAVRMESDCAVAWRAVLEQASGKDTAEQDRAFALTALTQSALMAARWRQQLGAWPVTEAFPGGAE